MERAARGRHVRPTGAHQGPRRQQHVGSRPKDVIEAPVAAQACGVRSLASSASGWTLTVRSSFAPGSDTLDSLNSRARGASSAHTVLICF